MMDFFGPGFDAAERIGILPRLQEVSYRVDAVEYVDSAWRPTARLDYEQFYRVLGGRLLSLMRPDLERVLLTAVGDVPKGRVQMHYGHRIGAVEQPIPDGVDLVIGADGIHSAVRRALFGDETAFLRDLGLRAAAFVVEEPDLHRLFAGRFVLTDTVRRQAGLYSLRDGRVAVFLVYRDPDLPPGEPAPVRLRRVFTGLAEPVDRVLAVCPDDAYDDMVGQAVVPAWHEGTTVLLGDACQAVSLLAGQGASLAIAGAALLTELVGPCRDAASVRPALAEYERRWRPLVEEKQAVGRRAAGTFLPETRRALLLRRVFLRAAALPGIDRLLARRLAGMTGLTS
jgi:2-polyprenyl-6-methoxyphenol hydroxylase-like FAD-dependent oxidoreductase